MESRCEIDITLATMKISSSLLCVLSLIHAGAAISETKTIQTPNGSVTATSKTVEQSPQSIKHATRNERLGIDKSASQARAFASAYLPGVSNPSLKDFDEAFRLWQREKTRRFTEDQVIELLGSYLGNRLVADFQMEWVVVTDKYGTEYAVRGKKVEVISFPFASVAKRIENNQYDFMVGVYYMVQDTIAGGDVRSR